MSRIKKYNVTKKQNFTKDRFQQTIIRFNPVCSMLIVIYMQCME